MTPSPQQPTGVPLGRPMEQGCPDSTAPTIKRPPERTRIGSGGRVSNSGRKRPPSPGVHTATCTVRAPRDRAHPWGSSEAGWHGPRHSTGERPSHLEAAGTARPTRGCCEWRPTARCDGTCLDSERCGGHDRAEEAWRARLALLLGMALRQKGPSGAAPRWGAPHTDWGKELELCSRADDWTRT